MSVAVNTKICVRIFCVFGAQGTCLVAANFVNGVNPNSLAGFEGYFRWGKRGEREGTGENTRLKNKFLVSALTTKAPVVRK